MLHENLVGGEKCQNIKKYENFLEFVINTTINDNKLKLHLHFSER